MIKHYRIIHIIFLLLSGFTVKGQDPFFSQFYNAPLTLNPALTGISYGNIRVTANYRNHLSAFDAFETYAFSLDMSLFENSMDDNFGGLGLVVVKDASGLGLENLKAMLSLAFHKSVGNTGNHYFAIGGQAGIDQTNLSLASLTTQSQWVAGQGLDRSLGNGETIQTDNSLLLDYQAGVMWYSFLGRKSVIFAGSSVFHISEPEKTFFNDQSRLNRRYVFHVGGKVGVGAKTSIVPNIVYMQQSNSVVINSGLLLEYDLSSNNQTQIISIGGWLRNTDAFIFNAGLEIKNFQLGVSYDMILSAIKDVTWKGGLELSLTYNFQKNIKSKTNLNANPNPRL